jgi:hypothetical protein
MGAFAKRREVGIAANLALEYVFVLLPHRIIIIVVVVRRHRRLGGWRHAMTNRVRPPSTIGGIVTMDGGCGGGGSGAAVVIAREDGNVPRGGECILLPRSGADVAVVSVGRVESIILARIMTKMTMTMMMLSVVARKRNRRVIGTGGYKCRIRWRR